MILDVPRHPTPDIERVLESGGPPKGYWMMGKRWPLCIWWRCSLCGQVVPLEPEDVDRDGIVAEPVHSEQMGGEGKRPLCRWRVPVRLVDYDADEHHRAVEAANREMMQRDLERQGGSE
jgi:hypothetical protein